MPIKILLVEDKLLYLLKTNCKSFTLPPLTKTILDGETQVYSCLVESMLKKLKKEDYDKLLNQQQKQLKKLIDVNSLNDFDIFYAPSGSDLCYFPIMFSRIINPDKKIFSVVTCPEELGTGSNTAIKGEYFFGINQFEENVSKNDIIHKDIIIDQQAFSARDDQGNILNHKSDILEIIDEKSSTNQVIANLVIGSKSGIADNISMIPRACLLYTSPSPRDGLLSRMPSSA